MALWPWLESFSFISAYLGDRVERSSQSTESGIFFFFLSISVVLSVFSFRNFPVRAMLNLWIWSLASWIGFYIFLSFLFLLLFPNSLLFLMGTSSPLFSNASVNLGRSYLFFKSLFLFLEHPCSYVVKALSLLNSQAIIVLFYFSSCAVHLCGDNSSLWDCSFLLMFPR